MSKINGKHNIIYIGLTEDRHIKIGVTQQCAYDRTYKADYNIKFYYDAQDAITNRKVLFWAESRLREEMCKHYPRHSTRHDCFVCTDSDFYIHFIDCVERLKKLNPNILPFGELIEYIEQAEYWEHKRIAWGL